MNFWQWEKSSTEYGRKLLNSGLEGARSGREMFLGGKSLTPLLDESARHAMSAAVVGAGVGVLRALSSDRNGCARRALAFGVCGGAFGFAAGILWINRRLGASIVGVALKNIDQVRDEHWLETHPIDYA